MPVVAGPRAAVIARAGAALAVVGGLLAALAVVPGTSPASAAVTDGTDAGTEVRAVRLVAAPANQGILTDGAELEVRITVENGGSTPLAAPTARLEFSPAPLPDVDAVRGWLGDDTPGAVPVVAEVEIVDLAPGATAVATLRLPAEAIDLAGQFGVRPVGVTLTSATGEIIATDRTAVVGQPAGTSSTGGSFAVVAPLTAPDARGRYLTADQLTALTDTGGPIDSALTAAETGGVVLGVDPRIIASVRLLGEAAPESATAALSRLEEIEAETFALRWSDADPLAAVGTLSTASPPLLGAGSAVIDAAGTSASTSISDLVAWPHALTDWVWPADQTLTPEAVAALSAESTRVVLTDARDLDGGDGLVRSLSADVRAVAADPVATAAVRAASESPRLQDRRAAVAELSALLAAAPFSSPPLVALSSRSLAPTTQLTTLVNDVLALPWARPGRLGSAAATSATLPTAQVTTENRIPAIPLATLLEVEQGDADFARIAVDPAPLIADRRLDLLDALAIGGETITAGEERFRRDSQELRSAVQVVESVTINLLAERTSLPVTVQNALPVPVRVFVAVESRTGQLRVEDPRVETTVPASSQVRALVPVQSLVNGDVDITVSVRAADDVTIGTPIQVGLNLQAGWETTGTIAIGAVIAALFALGLVRDIRRRRQQRIPAAPDADATADSTTPSPKETSSP